ncbi:MAG: exosortase/archaeosortase family protein [Chthoniobacterales bacterium]
MEQMTQPFSRPGAGRRPVGLWLVGAAFVVGWWLVLRACWWEWSLNAQYSYGMLVPLLVLMLGGRRWTDRPTPAIPARGGRVAAGALMTLAALGLALVQPLVLSNADWRMVPLVSAICGVTMTLGLVYLVGGGPWLRHFAFPVLFFLVAVPWPRPQENAIMSLLMERNSALNVEALHWFGYPAEQRGNLIALPGSLLGVEEACSGIRSLQSSIMVALAIGEFFRLTAARRIFLLALGLGTALLGNALRTLTLSVAACRAGSEAVDKIHDGTGLTVMVVSSLLVFFVGKLLAPRARTASEETGDRRQGTGDGRDFIPLSSFLTHQAKFFSLALLILWSGAWLGGEAWFRWHESRAAQAPAIWALERAGPWDNSRDVPLAERTLDVLLFPDTAFSEQWRDDQGWQWQAFYFHWPPGPTSVQSAFIVHDPRTCLGAAGFELETKLQPWTAEAGGFRIPFQRYLFRDRGRPVHVFHAVVEDDGSAVATGEAFDRGLRWNNMASGRRNRGLRVLELAVRGPLDAADAEASAAQWLQTRIKPAK